MVSSGVYESAGYCLLAETNRKVAFCVTALKGKVGWHLEAEEYIQL